MLDHDREPAVAGRFYPADPTQLRKDVASYLKVPGEQAKPALAVVGPHAGFMFSGATAGHTYARVEVPRKAIVLGPNHTGLGARFSVWGRGRWLMPFGPVNIAQGLVEALQAELPELESEPLAHAREHGIEVHVPFLQHLNADVEIVPLVCGFDDREACRRIGHAIARVIAAQPADDPILLVSSTDMSHFVSATDAHRLDHMAIGHIAELDPDGLYKTVRDNGITMCGVVPTTIVLDAVIELGATSAEFVEYTHSGVVTGDNKSVVGYAGLVIR